MPRIWVIAAAFALSTGVAHAEHVCRVPLANWHPREDLVRALAADGWTNIRVRLDDGCYKASAVKRDGTRLEALYDPGTLQFVAEHHRDEDRD